MALVLLTGKEAKRWAKHEALEAIRKRNDAQRLKDLTAMADHAEAIEEELQCAAIKIRTIFPPDFSRRRKN